jgi:hypothetical protein
VTAGLRNERRVAPMRRRFAAVSIDLVVVLFGLGVCVGASTRMDPTRSGRVKRAGGLVLKVVGSKEGMLTSRLVSFVLTVLLAGRPGPGARMLHIRLLDARTGGPLSRRQALLRVSVREAWRILAHRILPSPGDRPLQATTEKPQIPGVTQSLSAEPQQELQREMRIVHQTQTIQMPWGRILGRLVFANLVYIPILWTPLHQGLPDIVAGTAILIED